MSTELAELHNPAASLDVSEPLPPGCVACPNGLKLRDDLTRREWDAIGDSVCRLVSSANWLLGDWLAYGLPRYIEKNGKKKVPSGYYDALAVRTGYSVQLLMNAKSVCARLPIAQRRAGLTFSQAIEIIGRAPAEQVGFWVERAVAEKMPVRMLRAQLRQAGATYSPEANDEGQSSFLETAHQFVRDFHEGEATWTPKFRAEVAKILTPVFDRLAVDQRPGTRAKRVPNGLS